jgi:hypothetical protein
MSQNDQLEPQAEQDAEADGHYPPKDPLLAILVQGVNNSEWQFGVTLHVNGVIISGMLCSMTSFFKEQAEMIRQLGSPETAEGRQSFATIFDELAEDVHVDTGARDGDDDAVALRSNLPGFIHLRAATVQAPGTDAVLPETLWRGRLDHVSGWSIGNFIPKPPPRRGSTAG